MARAPATNTELHTETHRDTHGDIHLDTPRHTTRYTHLNTPRHTETHTSKHGDTYLGAGGGFALSLRIGLLLQPGDFRLAARVRGVAGWRVDVRFRVNGVGIAEWTRT